MSGPTLRLTAKKFLRTQFLPKVGKVTGVAFSRKYLLYTNVTISLSLSGVGDILEQHLEIIQGKQDKWDPKRTKRMMVSGVTVGIMCHYYYLILDKRLVGRTVKVLTKKLLIDQFVCSPLCVSIFLSTLAYLEGSSFEDFWEEVKRKAWRLYAAEWVVWPPAQIINFYFLPTKYRILYDSTISLGYDIYTSYVKHDS